MPVLQTNPPIVPPPDPDAVLPGPIAYLTSEYPKASHTFILREVTALRALGTVVLTCSIRRTGPEHHIGPEEAAAAAETFHVLDTARSPLRLLGAHLGLALRRPGLYARSLRLAWSTRRPGLRGLAMQAAYALEAGVLAAHLRRRGVRHLHNHFVNSNCTVAMLAAAMAGIGYSFTLHGPADLIDPAGWRLDVKLARARFAACISHYARSQAMLHTDPACWDRLRIVRCGVLPARYAATTTADGARTTGPDLLFVGRLAPVKGLRVLVEAFGRVLATHPSARLTLIGDGPDRATLEALAAPLGGAVRFTGYLSQQAVADALAGCDLFVLPSFAEGVPVVLMEAMASARPVVATRITGVPELVEDGTSGLLVPPGDPEALADAIATLVADPEARARMGAAGRARVTASFDVDREAARLKGLFAAAMTAP